MSRAARRAGSIAVTAGCLLFLGVAFNFAQANHNGAWNTCSQRGHPPFDVDIVVIGENIPVETSYSLVPPALHCDYESEESGEDVRVSIDLGGLQSLFAIATLALGSSLLHVSRADAPDEDTFEL